MGVRHYPDIPRVYFDFDGVIADFEKGATLHNLHPKQFKRVAGAYLNLDPLEGAWEAVQEVIRRGYQIFGLTKCPDENPYSAMEKLLWVKEHFPMLDGRVIISPDKGAVGSARDFLVDDHPEWANAHNFPGTILKFERNWDYILSQLPELDWVRIKIEKAY